MRSSSRIKILDAAARLVQREGIKSLTFDAVAAEAGLTKGGLLYHFASRDELVIAVHGHLARQWESSMIASAGKSADQATPAERHAAYARVNADGATRAELLFIVEGSTNPSYSGAWETVMDVWSPPVPAAGAGRTAIDQFIARLAADGLWMYEALSGEQLDPEVRRVVAERLAETIAMSEGDR